jgi:hypothetical protein
VSVCRSQETRAEEEEEEALVSERFMNVSKVAKALESSPRSLSSLTGVRLKDPFAIPELRMQRKENAGRQDESR